MLPSHPRCDQGSRIVGGWDLRAGEAAQTQREGGDVRIDLPVPTSIDALLPAALDRQNQDKVKLGTRAYD
jgi:hypothetical protein